MAAARTTSRARLLLESDEDLVVPTLVLAELDYWCARRLPDEAWLVFLDDVVAGVYRAALRRTTVGGGDRCSIGSKAEADSVAVGDG